MKKNFIAIMIVLAALLTGCANKAPAATREEAATKSTTESDAADKTENPKIEEDKEFEKDTDSLSLKPDKAGVIKASEVEANNIAGSKQDCVDSINSPVEDVPSEKPVQDAPVEEPAQEPVQEPVQEPIQEPLQEPIQEPVQEPVESDKYTPDEAMAVYRSLMEAGGITWDPSLKGNWNETIGQYPIEDWYLHMDGYNGCSWGTGFFYLDKGYAEWAAGTDLESFAIGNSGGNSWTKYYFEVTGFDDECVYFTMWSC